MGAKKVANSVYPVLCGGTFFTLVLEARGQRTSQRSRYEGVQDGLSQPETMAGLGRVIYPEYVIPLNKRTFSTNSNTYKTCSDDGYNLSFLHKDAVDAFDKRVKCEYAHALKAMCDFTNQFLEVGSSIKKEVRLVKALLELIEADVSIVDSQEFFVCQDGKGLTKSALRVISDFELQPFLLGVWHFVVTSRPDNRNGKATFNQWCPSHGRAERKYEGNMGNGIQREISIKVLTEEVSEAESTEVPEGSPCGTESPVLDADPKRITVNNYGTVQNQKFISVETMNGDIHL
jgi:hypothetical protein